MIDFDEAENRGSYYTDIGRSYLFDLDFHTQEKPYTLDACNYGNISRFVNHSCNPNSYIWSVWWDCIDESFPKLAIFSRRSIRENEEITFDYSGGDNIANKNKLKFLECTCGAINCKKILYT